MRWLTKALSLGSRVFDSALFDRCELQCITLCGLASILWPYIWNIVRTLLSQMNFATAITLMGLAAVAVDYSVSCWNSHWLFPWLPRFLLCVQSYHKWNNGHILLPFHAIWNSDNPNLGTLVGNHLHGRLDYQMLFEVEPKLLPESLAGRVRILFLVLTNHITTPRFLLGIYYLIRSIWSEVGQCGIDNVTCKRILETFLINWSKFKGFTIGSARKISRWPRCVPYSANRVGKIWIMWCQNVRYM